MASVPSDQFIEQSVIMCNVNPCFTTAKVVDCK